MRVASLVFVVAAMAALSAAHAQTAQGVEKARPAAEATVKPSTAAKSAAQSKAPTSEAGKAKVEGVATQRQMPADMKKSTDDCQSKGSAADA